MEVIDNPLDYNILFGHTWVYAMAAVISTYFHMITFSQKGRIVSIDQLTLFAFDSHFTRIVLLVGETIHSYQHVRVGLLKDSSLKGTFLIPPSLFLDNSSSVAYINMISSSTFQNDPWIVLDETSIHSFSDRMSLNPIELDYEAIYSACVMHTFSLINWFDRSLDDGTYFDPFSHVFSTDESIMEIMMLDDAPWNDHHLCSTLPGPLRILLVMCIYAISLNLL